jgi:hypothetical protein
MAYQPALSDNVLWQSGYLDYFPFVFCLELPKNDTIKQNN